MAKRIHHKNYVPRVNKHNLNQIWFKINTNPRRFDFREMKPMERYKAMIQKVKNALALKGLVKADDEIARQTA